MAEPGLFVEDDEPKRRVVSMSSFWLEYMQDGQRREFSFDGHTVSIGRDKTSDFVLDHPTVSRQHARIQFGQRGPQLVVLSRGGLTAIDGSQVQGEVDLFDGSEIHFGQLSFTFRSNEAPRRAQTNGTNGWQQQQQPQHHQQPAPQNGQSGNWNPQQSGTDWSKQSGTDWSQAGPASQSGTDWSKQSGTDWSKQSGTDWSAASQSGQGAAMSGGGWDIPADEPESDGGIVSWDEIAQAAESEESYAKQGVTDFEKMQQARAKLEKQSKGTNPVLVGVALVGIVGLLGFVFFGGSGPGNGPGGPDGPVDPLSLPVVSWMDSDIDCVGRAACEQAALDSYKVGKSTYEQREADLTNLYTAYSQLDRASEYIVKGEVTPIPAELADLEVTKKKLEGEMDARFQNYRVKFLDQKKKKQYREMVDILKHVYAYFPDKRSRYNKWAVAQELQMKDDGVYPPAPRF